MLPIGHIFCYDEFTCRYRLVRSRTSGSHPENTGSNPVGGTRIKLSGILPIDSATRSAAENGKKNPTLATIKKIADAFGLSADELLK